MLEFIFFILPFALSCIFGMSTLVLVKTRPKTQIVREPDDRDKLQLPENCTVFLARVFERRLVDAKIIRSHEMSVCETPGCPECANTKANRNEIARMERRSMRQVINKQAENLYSSDRAEKNSHRAFIDEQKRLGKVIPTHFSIPPSMVSGEIVSGEISTKMLGTSVKPFVLPDSHTGPLCECCDAGRGHRYNESHKTYKRGGEVVKTWHVVLDPITGEHLGDYSITNGVTEIRDFPHVQTTQSLAARQTLKLLSGVYDDKSTDELSQLVIPADVINDYFYAKGSTPEINVVDARPGVTGPRGVSGPRDRSVVLGHREPPFSPVPLKFDQPQFDYIEKVGNEITRGHPAAKRRNNLGYG